MTTGIATSPVYTPTTLPDVSIQSLADLGSLTREQLVKVHNELTGKQVKSFKDLPTAITKTREALLTWGTAQHVVFPENRPATPATPATTAQKPETTGQLNARRIRELRLIPLADLTDEQKAELITRTGPKQTQEKTPSQKAIKTALLARLAELVALPERTAEQEEEMKNIATATAPKPATPKAGGAGSRVLNLNKPLTTAIQPPREDSRRFRCLTLMSRPQGATLEQIKEACAWNDPQAIGAIRLLHSQHGYGVSHDLTTGAIRLIDATGDKAAAVPAEVLEAGPSDNEETPPSPAE